jgi:hypothetical protein
MDKQQRYEQTEKGKAARERAIKKYRKTEKGKAAARRYQAKLRARKKKLDNPTE